MKLSLWIISNWLEDYSPRIEGPKGPQMAPEISDMSEFIIIENVRLFTRPEIDDPNTIYVGISDNYFSDGDPHVVCRNGKYYIHLNTDDMPGILNEILNAFSFYSIWEEKVKGLMARRCTLTELLDASDEVLMNPLLVLDSSDAIVALSTAYRHVKVDDSWFDLLRNKSTFPEQIMDFHDKSKAIFDADEKDPFFIPAGFFPRDTYSQNLFYNHEWYGICTIIQFRQPLDTGMVHLFKIFCNYIQSWVNNQIDADIFKLNSAILTGAIEGEAEAVPKLWRKLAINGWNENHQMILINANALSQNFHTHTYLCRIFAAHSPFIFAATKDQSIILLCDVTGLPRKDLLNFLEPWFKKSAYSCGISYEFSDLESLPDAGRQAAIALEYAPKTAGAISTIDDHIVQWLMDILKQNAAPFTGHPILKTLKDYDARHSSDYYRTLLVYLQNERNNVATAAQLGIHRNTLFHRLERLRDHFHLSLDIPEERFYLLLSYHLQ